MKIDKGQDINKEKKEENRSTYLSLIAIQMIVRTVWTVQIRTSSRLYSDKTKLRDCNDAALDKAV